MFNLKFFIIVIFLLFSEITIYSQNPKSRLRITLSASVFDIITKQPIKEAELRITNQYKSTDSITLFSDKDGAFKYYDKYYELKCNVNDVFKITFSAKNYNSRTVFFDFRGILDKDIFDQGYEVPIDLPLEKLEINSDSSITNLLASIPSGRISYNPNTGELDWDMIQINSYKKTNVLVKDFYRKRQSSDSLKIIQFENEKTLTKNQAELSSKRTQQYFLYGGIILVLIFAGFIYNRFKIARKQKLLIEHQKSLVDEKNREIMDSIRYAKRIQQSLLPSKKYIERILNRNK